MSDTTLSDIGTATRAIVQNTSAYVGIPGMGSVSIDTFAVASGTYKIYGAVDYDEQMSAADKAACHWVPIASVDTAGVVKLADAVITPSTTKTVRAITVGYRGLKITEQNAGTVSVRVVGSQLIPMDLVMALAASTGITVGHGKTIKNYSATISADTDVVPAVTAKRIKVFAYSIINESNTAVTPLFKSGGSAGTELWRVHLKGAAADTPMGANLATAVPSFIFGTVAGEKLTVDVGSAAVLHVSLAFWDDDAV